MNHTQRITETARHHRHLSRRMAKEAIETYLELLAEEIAKGEWVDIYGIGKIKIDVEASSGLLTTSDGKPYNVTQRLRTRIRLSHAFKKMCYVR